MARKIEVQIVGDASSLSRAFSRSAASAQAFEGRFNAGPTRALRLMGYAAVGAGAVVGGALVVGLKRAIDSANEHAKAAAQTNAVLKSTGGAANVTTNQILTLSNAIEKKTGVDDLAVQSGENMLLTFTNIRNEVGKGNDIFTQATKTVTDMSVALGEDTKNAAIQLGKALNDPVKGMTALQRVGVSFTKAQKDQVAALVKAGDTMGAQKLILRELNKEFGGSADAMGRTLPGQINILKARFDDLAQNIGQKLVPVLAQGVQWVNDHWPEISAVVNNVFAQVKTAVQGAIPVFMAIANAVQEHWPQISATISEVFAVVRTEVGALIALDQRIVAAIQEHWPQISAAAAQVATGVQKAWGFVRSVFEGVVEVIRTSATVAIALWNTFGSTIVAYTGATFRNLWQIIKGAFDVIEGLFRLVGDLIHGRWSQVWEDVKQILRGAINVVAGILRQAVATIEAVARLIGTAIMKAFEAAFNAVVAIVRGGINLIISALRAAPGAAVAAAAAIGMAITRGITNGLKAVAAVMTGFAMDIMNALIGVGFAVVGAAVSIGTEIVEGIKSGFMSMLGDLKSTLESGVHAVVSALNPFSPVAHGGEVYIGRPLAEGTIRGWILGSAELPSKLSETVRNAVMAARAAVDSARTVFQDAWSRLADYALRAFDAKTQAGLDRIQAKFDKIRAQIDAADAAPTPAEKELAAEQAARDQADRNANIAKAQADLNAAQTPEEVAAAQKELDDAEWAQRQADLEAQAAQERAAADAKAEKARAAADRRQAEAEKQYQAERDLQRQHLQDQLDALEKALEREGAAHQKAHAKIMALFKRFGIDYKESGRELGLAFARGIEDSETAVGKAAEKIAAAAARKLELHSPAKEGPLSTLDKWWVKLPDTLVAGVDTGRLAKMTEGITAPKFSGRVTGGDGVALRLGAAGPTAGPAVGGVTWTGDLVVQGTVIHERDLALTVRNQLKTFGYLNVDVGLS